LLGNKEALAIKNKDTKKKKNMEVEMDLLKMELEAMSKVKKEA